MWGSHNVPWPEAGGYVDLVNLSRPYVLQPAAAKVGVSGTRGSLYQMRDSLQYAATPLQPAAARSRVQRQQRHSRGLTNCSGTRPAACSSSIDSLMQHWPHAHTTGSNNCSGSFNAFIVHEKQLAASHHVLVGATSQVASTHILRKSSSIEPAPDNACELFLQRLRAHTDNVS